MASNSKRKFKSEAARKAVWAEIERAMQGNYHNIYTKLGLEQGRSGNFHCFNKTGHSEGKDNNPSLSINNDRGVYNCKTCGIKGNFQKYVTENVISAGESYTDFTIDFLNLSIDRFLDTLDESGIDENNVDDFNKMMKDVIKERTSGISIAQAMRTYEKKTANLKMSLADGYTKNLLNNPEKAKYLEETRNMSLEYIESEKIGWDPVKHSYTFPLITHDGYLKNIYLYNPDHPDYKWIAMDKNRGMCPTPYSSFSGKRLFCMEGYPDTHCAKTFGYSAFTLGPANVTNIEEAFGGEENCRRIFSGKEVIIVFDDDDESKQFIPKVAAAYYKYASQVKVLSLRKSKDNPNGLDPDVTREINGKVKRIEKDFTDFMRINGFDDSAKYEFDRIIDNTAAWAPDEDRTGNGVVKLTLQESKGKKYNSNTKKRVPITIHASVVHTEQRSYQYPMGVCVSCPKMEMADSGHKLKGKCAQCNIVMDERFGRDNDFSYKFQRDKDKAVGKINISEKDIIEFVDLPEWRRLSHIKKLLGIPTACQQAIIDEDEIGELLFMHLIPPSSEYGIEFEDNGTHNTHTEQEAFLNGMCIIESNKTYKFEGFQVTSPKNGHAVLFFDKVTPISTSIDKFEMTDQAYDILSKFQEKPGETLDEHFDRRYKNFGARSGIFGREDLFMLTDWAYFSTPELTNDVFFPNTTVRGYVEVLLAGDTRTGKTWVTKHQLNRYRIGDLISGSSGISRAGLIGCVNTKGNQRSSVTFGKFATNDRGLIAIDETTDIPEPVFKQLTAARSEGKVQIVMAGSGSAPARVRKIWISNPRVTDNFTNQHASMSSVETLLKICLVPQHLSRFDAAIIVKSDDVDIAKEKHKYSNVDLNEFTPFMCQTAINFIWSRTKDDYLWEEGVEDFIDTQCQKLSEFFHEDTHLINREMRLKLLRISASVAGSVYSHPEHDRTKIIVRRKHVEYVVKKLIDLYTSKNMLLDKWSEQMWRSERLGDMNYMENILKYIDPTPLIRESSFNMFSLQSIFYDYLLQVNLGTLYLPFTRENNKNTGIKPHEGIYKVISQLVISNALRRSKVGGYTKTTSFSKWLEEKVEEINEKGEEAFENLSDVLQVSKDEHHLDLTSKYGNNKKNSGSA